MTDTLTIPDTNAQRPQTIAHVSDLHIGRSQKDSAIARRIVDMLVATDIDHVIVTGDMTHLGKRAELDEFYRLFGPLIAAGKLDLIPGNHDRAGEGAGSSIMKDARVDVTRKNGVYLIRIDTTGAHNNRIFRGQGILDQHVLDDVDLALRHADANDLAVVALHHHLEPLPEEYLSEKISAFFGLPYAAELRLGPTLLQNLQGRCDLVLHGHRHVPMERIFPGERPLGLYNAGSSTDLARYRVFTHLNGKLLGPPVWVSISST